jgi:hypothetical protein
MTPTTYKLKCLSRWLRDATLGWLWAWRLGFRLAQGEWCVFHDAPWWVLKMCAGPGYVPETDMEAEVVRLARIESNLRLRRGRFEP